MLERRLYAFSPGDCRQHAGIHWDQGSAFAGGGRRTLAGFFLRGSSRVSQNKTALAVRPPPGVVRTMGTALLPTDASSKHPSDPGWSDDYIRSQIPRYNWFVHVNFGNGIVARSTHWPNAPADSR